MGNYSTDISKAENRLSSQITEYENDDDSQVLYVDRYQYVEVLKRWMGSDTSGSWICDLHGKTGKYKRYNKTCTNSLTLI